MPCCIERYRYFFGNANTTALVIPQNPLLPVVGAVLGP